jgi:2-polyprenyl-6-methoxyphenol hydroxylase-like FAD-dependent oxidoreductase
MATVFSAEKTMQVKLLDNCECTARTNRSPVTLITLRTGDGSLPESLHDVAAYYKMVDEITSEEGSYQPALDVLRILEEAFPETTTGSLMKKYKVPTMNHVRYDLMKALPDNFAAHGDALINLNPIFGQGCTKAAMDATTLDAFLRAAPANHGRVPSGFSKRMTALQTLRNRSMFDSTRWMGLFV